MLLSFSIENFRSFREETTLSMLADRRVTDHPEQVAAVQVPGDAADGVLRYGLLYGPNNCGKSNLVMALWRLSVLASRGGSVDTLARQANLYNRELGKPVRMEIYFLNRDRIFHYGLSLTDGVVDSEWLYSCDEAGEEVLFERSVSGVTWGVAVMGPEEKYHGFLDYVGSGCPRDQLLLREASVRNVHAIEPATDWFRRVLLISANLPDGLMHESLYHDPSLTNFVGDLMGRADTGISQIGIDQKEWENGSKDLVALRIKATKSERAADGQAVVTYLDEHESDGTRRLPTLFIPLRLAKDGPPVYLLDEVERSLHSELTDFVIRQYLETCIAHGGQMIVATHDTRLMTAEKIRRDGVWFMDLVPGHGSRLRSLGDFEPRGPISREKRYLEGRFGGVPIIEGVPAPAQPEAGVAGA
jgi:hypothetical protein